MLLLETDPIAVAGLIVAVVSALIAIHAAWAALKALSFATDTPSKADLERVKGNTLRTAEAEELQQRASRVRIRVSGGYDFGEELEGFLIADCDAVSFERVDLMNKTGSLCYPVRCEKLERVQIFRFVVPYNRAGSWLASANPDSAESHDKNLCVRVYMRFDDNRREVFRDVPVCARFVTFRDPEKPFEPFVKKRYDLEGEV